MADVLYFNGRFTTTDERVLGVEDRGFQFGDAVYEVFKFVAKKPAFLLDHYRRMERCLREIEIACPWSEPEFEATVKRPLVRSADVGQGIVLDRHCRGLGSFLQDDGVATWFHLIEL